MVIVWVCLLMHVEFRKKRGEVVRYNLSKTFMVIDIGTNQESPYVNYTVHYVTLCPVIFQ